MRELKFRAWVKRGLYPDNMYWFDIRWGNYYQGNGWIGMLPIGENDKNKRFQVDPDDVEIMQYTGLKDKNGVEIYEGDIVEYNHAVSISNEFPLWRGIVKYLISEYKSAFWVYSLDNKHINDDSFYTHNMTIIGNIYENPDLLK